MLVLHEDKHGAVALVTTIPSALRETAEDGLVNTPTGRKLKEQVLGK